MILLYVHKPTVSMAVLADQTRLFNKYLLVNINKQLITPRTD